MTPDRTPRLFDTFPRLYRGRHLPLTENLMSFGFMCDDGWFDLVHALSQQIVDYAARTPAVQDVMAFEVKEKFGELRFYIDGGDAHVEALIDAAMAKSLATCERDGSPGRLRKQPGRNLKTLCDTCARAFGYDEILSSKNAP